jgi:hypothetical protein
MTKPGGAEFVRQLPFFEEFASSIRKYLKGVRPVEAEALLETLYAAAKRKLDFDKARDAAPGAVREIRQKKAAMAKAGKLLAQALRILKKAQKQYPDQLWNIGSTVDSLEDDRQSLPNTIRYLESAVKGAADWQVLYSGLIHPQLRTRKSEQREAAQELPSGIVAGTILPLPTYAARQKSPDIDHWFIGEAAKCLDPYKTVRGKPIPGYPKVIAALFWIAFREKRSEDSIRIELRRQRKNGRPESPFVLPTHRPRVSLAMGQKSTRHRFSKKTIVRK